jgi:hypothetical protein
MKSGGATILFGLFVGASVIKCCYAARDIGISSTVDENVDLPNANMTLIDFTKVIADEKISLNVSRRLVSPICIAGVLTSLPNSNAL